MLARFRTFADALVEQAERFGLTGELIVVEWNPPDAPPLRNVLGLHQRWDGFPVRYIVVSPELHDSLPNSGDIPLFQMIAKNVGIRRARGRYVLATNPDLLFSNELVQFLASGALQDDAMFRINRTDVRSDVPNACVTAQLEWSSRNVVRVNTRWGTFRSLDLASIASRVCEDLLLGVVRALAWLLTREQYRGASSPSPARRVVQLSRILLKLSRILLKLSRILLSRALDALEAAIKLLGSIVSTLPKVHTNGCGDFTLLSRDAWHALRGYAELPIWSMHLDSLLCYQAVAAGYREIVLARPMRIFHIEHGNSWVTMDAQARLRTFARKPWLDSELLAATRNDLFRRQGQVRFNEADWGFGDRDLPEFKNGVGQELL